MLDEGTYRYTLILANVYYEGTFFYINKYKKMPKIHTVDCIKILTMVIPSIHALLVTMLFRTIHKKYSFMKRKHSRTLETKL